MVVILPTTAIFANSVHGPFIDSNASPNEQGQPSANISWQVFLMSSDRLELSHRRRAEVALVNFIWLLFMAVVSLLL